MNAMRRLQEAVREIANLSEPDEPVTWAQLAEHEYGVPRVSVR